MDTAAPGSTSRTSCNIDGRTREALEVARQGLEAESSSPWRTVDWLRLYVVEYSYYLGDWAEAREISRPRAGAATGGKLFVWQHRARGARTGPRRP